MSPYLTYLSVSNQADKQEPEEKLKRSIVVVSIFPTRGIPQTLQLQAESTSAVFQLRFLTEAADVLVLS